MPTRKQRKRREKTFRHEFDYVEEDESGNEVAVDPAELRKPKKEPAKAKPQQRKGRPVREVQPPTWRRALKRGGLMGAALFAVMLLLDPRAAPIAVIYGGALIPFTYWIDRVSYRNYLKRSGKAG
jgi:hypothetical protein